MFCSILSASLGRHAAVLTGEGHRHTDFYMQARKCQRISAIHSPFFTLYTLLQNLSQYLLLLDDINSLHLSAYLKIYQWIFKESTYHTLLSLPLPLPPIIMIDDLLVALYLIPYLPWTLSLLNAHSG